MTTSQPRAEPRRRAAMPPSPTATSSSARSTDSGSASSVTLCGRLHGVDGQVDANLNNILAQLPSSPKELLQRLERQRDEIRLLQEENVRLKSREVEVSALTLRLQQQFSATQAQIDTLKTQIQLQLANPITDDEYTAIESLPEAKRDLLDTIKISIYRQIGSLRASSQAATRRAAELSATVSKLTDKQKDLQLATSDALAARESEREAHQRHQREQQKQNARVLELEATVRDLEGKLRGIYVDQEAFLTAKLHAQIKAEEVARLGVRLNEAEVDVERYKAGAECCEQKLDILKSEYYELKLKHTQRCLELETALKASEEKLKMYGDLELESELFVSNLAQSSERGGAGSLSLLENGDTNTAGAALAGVSAYESFAALPRSRKMAHTLVVTKRCLQLENRLAALHHDVEFKDRQMCRLQASLSAARDALNNVNSPYILVEKTVERLTEENDALKERARTLEEDNKALRGQLCQRTADISVLCKHRGELLRMKQLLRKLGYAEATATVEAAIYSGGGAVSEVQQQSEIERDEATHSGAPKMRRSPIPSGVNTSIDVRGSSVAGSPPRLHSAARTQPMSRSSGDSRDVDSTNDFDLPEGAAVCPGKIQFTS